MHSLVLRGVFRPGVGDEVIRACHESIPEFRQQAGFHSVTYLYDRSSGAGLGVTVWDSQAHIDAARDAIRRLSQPFLELMVNSDAPMEPLGARWPIFEVVAQG